MTESHKNDNWKLKTLGIYQVAGGVVGIALIGWLLIYLKNYTISLMLLMMVPLVWYGFSIHCGISLLKRSPWALKLSLINQYMQLINFSILGYSLQYVAGPGAYIGFDLTNTILLNLSFDLFTKWDITIATNSPVILINLNVVALMLIIFIKRMKSRMSAEEELEVLAIGEGMK
jgi:hypothetical protein